VLVVSEIKVMKFRGIWGRLQWKVPRCARPDDYLEQKSAVYNSTRLKHPFLLFFCFHLGISSVAR